eukprot:COSAG06_NODE_508_length_14925_cov_18.648995_11_plen_76_part_00
MKAISTGKHYMAYDCENCRALGDGCMPNSNHTCTTDRTNFNANVSARDQVGAGGCVLLPELCFWPQACLGKSSIV